MQILLEWKSWKKKQQKEADNLVNNFSFLSIVLLACLSFCK